MFDQRRRMTSLRCFNRSLAGTAPFDTMCPRGKEEVKIGDRELGTESHKPTKTTSNMSTGGQPN
jgi:hypothetical protein